MRLPLLGGSYRSRWVGANGQQCLNYYPEINPKDSPVPVSFYQRPGLRPLAQGPVLPVRGVWQASNGNGYCVIGAGVYSISPSWQLKLLGGITPSRTNLCSFVDNGIDGLLVDGSTSGWRIHLADNSFFSVDDTTGTFFGSNLVDYLDTFILYTVPGTNKFGSTLSNTITFDPLYVAAKTGWPDPLMGLKVNRRELLLFGQLKSEIWYDAGNPNFPFAELPGSYIEQGAAAKFSINSQDISTYWLGRDLQGVGIVWKHKGYQTGRVSNHALEYAIRKIYNIVGVEDALSYCYQQDGHTFYVLTFPAGDQTWVLDDTTNEWHQRGWTDPQTGLTHRERANCGASLYGQIVVGDWENGTLYALDQDQYFDTVAGVQCPLSCIRTFPHITQIMDPNTRQPMNWDGRRIRYTNFELDLQCGEGAQELGQEPAKVSIRWSDDRGNSFGEDVLQSAGQPGQFITFPNWRGLGIARDRIFEISHAIKGPAALNGAWIDGVEAAT